MIRLKYALRTGTELLSARKYLDRCVYQVCPCHNSTDYEIKFKPKFSNEECEKILRILNNSDVKDLERYNISQTRIKSIKSWRNRKGSFQSLNDILEVDGLSVKVLEKLCESIITNLNHPTDQTSVKAVKINHRQFLSPPVTVETLNKLTTTVALHVGPSGISWARLNRECVLDDWDFDNFITLPKKPMPADIFHLAVNVLRKIPFGDSYILEGSNNNGLQNGKTSMISTQQLELTSMLIALINTSSKHNPVFCEDFERNVEFCNKVYFLKSKLPARLFGTLVGSERVSAIDIVSQLLEGTQDSQPYSAVIAKNRLKNAFMSHSAINKELLGQSLMLAVTFMDLCVKKIPSAYKAVVYKGK